MADFPAGLDGVTFSSGGCRLLGAFYRAAGNGPRPTALLVHGLPGVEKNLDVAYAMRDAGWNCLLFHFRGSWGSQGDYSLFQLTDDLYAAADWAVQQQSVDPRRLALVGHSMGGYIALTAAAHDPRFRAIVAICPLASPVRAPLSLDLFDEFANMLHGVTPTELRSQYEALPAIEASASGLAGRPILMITGGQDDVFPPDHYPPLLRVLPAIEWHELPEGDHSMSLCRGKVVSLVAPWLASHVGE
jgi:dipeptidyl aminopeptidase/acylaminoacyl peptidase